MDCAPRLTCHRATPNTPWYSRKIARALRKLDTSYNPTAIDDEPGDEEEKENEIASPPVELHYVYNASLASDPGLPRTYEEAMSGPDKLKWSKAIEKELANFEM